MFHEEFIDAHAAEILSKGFRAMLDWKKYDELKMLYDMFQHNPQNVQLMRGYLQEYVKSKCKDYIGNTSELIHNLIKFINLLNTYLQTCFGNNMNL